MEEGADRRRQREKTWVTRCQELKSPKQSSRPQVFTGSRVVVRKERGDDMVGAVRAGTRRSRSRRGES